MFVETPYLPRSKPQRGERCILKLILIKRELQPLIFYRPVHILQPYHWWSAGWSHVSRRFSLQILYFPAHLSPREPTVWMTFSHSPGLDHLLFTVFYTHSAPRIKELTVWMTFSHSPGMNARMAFPGANLLLRAIRVIRVICGSDNLRQN